MKVSSVLIKASFRVVSSSNGRMDFGVVSSSIWRKNCGTDGLKFHGPPAMKCVNFTELSPGDRLGDEMNCVVWTSNLTSNVPAFVGWRNFQNLGVPNGYHPTSSISRGRSSVWRKNCVYQPPGDSNSNLNLSSWELRSTQTGLQRRWRGDVKDFLWFWRQSFVVVQSPLRHRPLVGHDDDVGHFVGTPRSLLVHRFVI